MPSPRRPIAPRPVSSAAKKLRNRAAQRSSRNSRGVSDCQLPFLEFHRVAAERLQYQPGQDRTESDKRAMLHLQQAGSSARKITADPSADRTDNEAGHHSFTRVPVIAQCIFRNARLSQFLGYEKYVVGRRQSKCTHDIGNDAEDNRQRLQAGKKTARLNRREAILWRCLSKLHGIV